jgi:tetratricopeptide (TPR) repeat protein
MLSASRLVARAWQEYQAGHWPQAVDYLESALRIKPDFAEAHNQLGLALQQLGRVRDALFSYERAVQLKPDLGEAHNNLGSLLRRQGKLTEAVVHFERALHLMPASAEMHYNLANALKEQGKLAEAAAHYRQAIHLRPDFAWAHHNLGIVLLEQGVLIEAEGCLNQVLRIDPSLADAHYNLGIVYQEQGKLNDAVAALREALQLNPNHREAHNNLGVALRVRGEWADAEVSFEQALRLNLDFAEARNNRAMLWLLLGKYEQGWREYKWRWRTRPFSSSPRPGPLWDGGPLGGKTIMLHAEQGLGDTLQFIRYAAVVKERGATVLVACQPELLGVLSGCPGVDRLLPQDGPLPACAMHAPLLSLPGLCGTTLPTIPATVPYLVAAQDRVARWRQHLAAVPGFKVGICWQGSPRHQDDRRRSVPLSQFQPLAEVPGIRLVPLQRGPGEEQWAACARRWPVVELPGLAQGPSEAWVETAALIAALDLVVTVDTAVAHLAGALGRPVWVPLQFSPDWRWLLQRIDSPWYPTMRLFRQSREGDWAGVFARIAAELRHGVQNGI